jgi:hypothetical protein
MLLAKFTTFRVRIKLLMHKRNTSPVAQMESHENLQALGNEIIDGAPLYYAHYT